MESGGRVGTNDVVVSLVALLDGVRDLLVVDGDAVADGPAQCVQQKGRQDRSSAFFKLIHRLADGVAVAAAGQVHHSLHVVRCLQTSIIVIIRRYYY